MFEPKAFREALFYIGAGADLQLILRTSHHVDRIIAPTLSRSLTVAQVQQRFIEKCRTVNRNYGRRMLELTDVEELPTDLRHGFPASAAFFMSEDEYLRHVRTVVDDMPTGEIRSLYRFTFRRHVGSEVRKVEWFLVEAEGLGLLIDLHARLQTFPRFIATIQSGGLEASDSLLALSMQQLGAFPDVWFRGRWGGSRFNRTGIPRSPLFPHLVQDPLHYDSRLGVDSAHGEESGFMHCASVVQAFSRKIMGHPAPLVIESACGSRRVEVRYGTVDDHLDGCGAVFTSRWHGVESLHEGSPEVFFWEDFMPAGRKASLPPLMLAEALALVGRHCAAHQGKRVCMSLTGFEDEATQLRELVDSDVGSRVDLRIVVAGALEFEAVRQRMGKRTNTDTLPT